MECASCNERLADFLLDELPEGEAVLVQEHLNLCQECMRTYRDLKGTGKALSAVTSMRAVEGSTQFKQAVREKAAVELTEIVGKLPPDKRLKLEARRAARMSRVIERPQPRSRYSLSTSILLVVLAGLVALTVILIYPRHNSSLGQREPLGSLSVTMGRVEQFYVRPNEPHTAVKEGKNILPGDAYSTQENSCARFDVRDGSSLFLGPKTQITFRMQANEHENFVIVLEKGELGVQRPAQLNADEGVTVSQYWEVRSDAGTMLLGPGDHAYMKSTKSAKDFSGEVLVIAGSAELHDRSGHPVGTLNDSQHALISGNMTGVSPENLPNARVPAWRVDLTSEADLAKLISAQTKIVARRGGTVQAEVVYDSSDLKRGLHDWVSDNPAAAERANALTLPPGVRMRNVLPFTAPLTVEINLPRDSQRDASFAFGALESAESGAAVDVTREAALQIREKGRAVRSVTVPARTQAGKIERLRLEVSPEGGNFAVQLSSSVDKGNKPLSLAKEKNDKPELWLQGLGDGVNLREVKISGVIPTEWLREQLSK